MVFLQSTPCEAHKLLPKEPFCDNVSVCHFGCKDTTFLAIITKIAKFVGIIGISLRLMTQPRRVLRQSRQII